MSEGSEEGEHEKEKPSYSWFDIRKYLSGSGKAREFAWTRLAFLLFLFALVTIGVYGYYYLQSPGGRVLISNALVTIGEWNPITLIEKWLAKAQDIGNIYDTESNSTSSEKGIILKDFKLVSSEQVPKGEPVYIKYDIRIVNDFLKRIPVKLKCNLRNKDVDLQLLPSDTITLSGARVTEEARCLVPRELTKNLDGTQQVDGWISFPYKTENVALNVYFVSDSVYNELKEDQDFFSYYDIPESNPIRPLYNGEPVEIGIGVSSENLQPVVVREGVSPLVGITLKNAWDGKVVALNDLTLQLPEGIEINSELSQNPSLLCPFEQGVRNGEYRMASSMRSLVQIEEGRSRTFECWLNVLDVLEPGTPYTKRQYKISADYEYQSKNKTASFIVRSVQ